MGERDEEIDPATYDQQKVADTVLALLHLNSFPDVVRGDVRRLMGCGREDSNLHGLRPLGPKPSASSNSATPA